MNKVYRPWLALNEAQWIASRVCVWWAAVLALAHAELLTSTTITICQSTAGGCRVPFKFLSLRP